MVPILHRMTAPPYTYILSPSLACTETSPTITDSYLFSKVISLPSTYTPVFLDCLQFHDAMLSFYLECPSDPKTCINIKAISRRGFKMSVAWVPLFLLIDTEAITEKRQRIKVNVSVHRNLLFEQLLPNTYLQMPALGIVVKSPLKQVRTQGP